MNEELEKWLTEITSEELSNALQVGEVISDYFGEELVDVQLPSNEDTIKRALNNLTVRMLIHIHQSDSENYVLKSNDDTLVTIPRQEYLAECNKKVLEGDINSLYFPLIEDSVKNIFRNYIEGLLIDIIIRFPHVTVTNENDKSIDITELYAKVTIRNDGKLFENFTLMRTEYTVTQWLSGYSHSHMPSTEFIWQSPCLGSGPIRNTQHNLKNSFNYDLWGLFCYELSKYVTVESLAGVPYRRLESVGGGDADLSILFTNYNYNSSSGGSYHRVLHEFEQYFVREFNFPISFVNGAYVLGDSCLNFVRKLTDFFAAWYNKEVSLGHYNYNLQRLTQSGLLNEYIISDGQIFSPYSTENLSRTQSIQGRELFMFKGKMVTANFTEEPELNSENTVLLIKSSVVTYLLTRILRLFNCKYGSQNNNSSESSNSEEAASSEGILFI